MAEPPPAPDAQRQRAAELYAEGQELFERKQYYEARERYAESLRLHDDEEVRAAYHIVMSAIGPM